jgi:hypothetical protein
VRNSSTLVLSTVHEAVVDLNRCVCVCVHTIHIVTQIISVVSTQEPGYLSRYSERLREERPSVRNSESR